MKQLHRIPLYLASIALSLSAFAMNASQYDAVREKHPPTATSAFKGIKGLPALQVFEMQGVVKKVADGKPVKFTLEDKDEKMLTFTSAKPDADIVAGAKLRVLGHVVNDGKYESLAVTPFKEKQAKPAAPADTDNAPATEPAENTPTPEQPTAESQPAEQPVETTPPTEKPVVDPSPAVAPTFPMPAVPPVPANVAVPAPPPATVETPAAPPVADTPPPAQPTVETPATPSSATPAPPEKTEAHPAPKRSVRPVPTSPAPRPGLLPRMHENSTPARPSMPDRFRSRF